jgi:hypothetical protein
LPPSWCFPEGRERARAPIGVGPSYRHGQGYWSGNYPTSGYAHGPAPAQNY